MISRSRRVCWYAILFLVVALPGACSHDNGTAPTQPPPPTRLAFVVQPSPVMTDAAIAPAVQVVVQDAQGSTVTTSTASITVAITSGSGNGGAVLGGTLTRAAVSGVAVFDDLTVDKVGTGYTLRATSTSLTGATSDTFTVYGAPSKLAFLTQPSTTASEQWITPAIEVAVEDSQGHTVISSTASISMTVTGGSPPGAGIGGRPTRAAVSGVATFDSLSMTLASSGCMLIATSSGLASDTSDTFTITPGPPSKLAFTVQPSSVVDTQRITPAVEVTVQDAVGNTVTEATDTVTMALGLPTATLSGTDTVVATQGIATFTNLRIDRLGSDYTLIASATGLNGATSAPFAVTRTFAEVSAGGTDTCGVTSSGAAYCWGRNADGELGDGTTFDRSTPGAVLADSIFTSVSAGYKHTCGVTTAGAAYCWGRNAEGQLGDGTTTSRTSPVAVQGGLTFVEVSAGEFYTCGVTTGGAAYCWGYGGALGIYDSLTVTQSLVPAPVVGGLTFAMVSAGDHTCGVTTGSAAYCWGSNGSGELGDTTANWQPAPTAVLGGLSFAAVSASTLYHTCGVTTGGAAYCWGNNSSGQLGGYAQTIPVAVVGGLTFAEVSAGFEHSCGVTTGGAAYCWGSNIDGALGDSSGFAQAGPVPVRGGLSFAAVVAAGDYHTCGVTVEGAAYCWGSNGSGQLGDGTRTRRPVPVRVAP